MAYKVIFINKNIPNSFLISPEVSKIYKGEVGIIDSGGAYFPAFFSSYGIIGLFFLLPLIRQYFYFFKRWERIIYLNIIFNDIYNHICCISLGLVWASDKTIWLL